ncbi:MAG: hypothetical protein LBI33_05350 [Propionibacteriaceae bacterium]|nr:hypothetical protein [Propionibacteriaceae bacterium]
MAALPVFLDANVLMPISLADLLLRTAEAGLINLRDIAAAREARLDSSIDLATRPPAGTTGQTSKSLMHVSVAQTHPGTARRLGHLR